MLKRWMKRPHFSGLTVVTKEPNEKSYCRKINEVEKEIETVVVIL